MPFRSEKQRRFMWSKHPEIAKRWASEAKGKKGRKARKKKKPDGRAYANVRRAVFKLK